MAQQGSTQQTQYTVVATNENESDKPPSYFNIVGQIKQVANGEKQSPAKVGQTVYEILCNSVFFGVFLVLASILPVANLVIGILYKNKCTIQPNIPLFLIVIGTCGIAIFVARFVSNLVLGIKARKSGDQPKNVDCLTCVFTLLALFVFIWFLIGNYWVYSIYNRVQYDQDLFPNEYCHKLCYLFSFWSITATWIMIGLFCLGFCGILGLVMACTVGICFGKK